MTFIEFNGQKMSVKDLSRISGVDHKSICQRIRSGKTVEESLYRRLILKKNRTKHIIKERQSYFDGAAKSVSSEYCCWYNMVQRCTNKKRHDYHRYGGRKITVCERWYIFEDFIQDMGKRPSYQYSIERRDNNLGYNKNNCYWGSVEEQSNNRRDNVYITHKGKTRTIQQWSRETGIGRHVISSRLNLGKSGEDLFKPIKESLSHRKNVID